MGFELAQGGGDTGRAFGEPCGEGLDVDAGAGGERLDVDGQPDRESGKLRVLGEVVADHREAGGVAGVVVDDAGGTGVSIFTRGSEFARWSPLRRAGGRGGAWWGSFPLVFLWEERRQHRNTLRRAPVLRCCEVEFGPDGHLDTPAPHMSTDTHVPSPVAGLSGVMLFLTGRGDWPSRPSEWRDSVHSPPGAVCGLSQPIARVAGEASAVLAVRGRDCVAER